MEKTQTEHSENHQRERLLVELVEQSTDMISYHTPGDWTFIYASPAVEVILGFTQEEIIGLSAYDLYHPDDVEDFRNRRPTVIYGQGFYTHTYRFKKKDGSYTWLESTSKSIRDADTNSLKEILVVSRDVSHRVDAEQKKQDYQNQIYRSSRLAALGEMASGLAHELNQPLTAIVNYAGGIERLAERDPGLKVQDIREPLERISATAHRASSVLYKIMNFAKVREPAQETVDMNELAKELVDFCTVIAQSRSVVIEVPEFDQLPDVLADKVLIEQVLLNLLINAIEASEQGNGNAPRVWFEGKKLDDNRIQISVNDEGCGLPDITEEQLYEQFFTTKKEGLGMGLAICRTIIEAHGGCIRAKNRQECGACFTVQLPINNP